MFTATCAPTPLYSDSYDQSFSFYEDDSAYWSFCSDYTELIEEKPMMCEPQMQPELPINYPLTPETVSPATPYDYSISDMAVPPPMEYYMPSAPEQLMYTPMPSHQGLAVAPPMQAPPIHAPPPHPPHFVQQPTIRSAAPADTPAKRKTPENLAIKLQSTAFHHSFPAVRMCSSRALSLHMPLAMLDQHRKAHIMLKAVEKGLNSDVVAAHLEMFPDNDWANDVPNELRVLPVINVDIGGTAVDSKSKHVKRPLNSFMIYRKAQTQRARVNAVANRQKINHQTISSIVGLLWQTEGAQVHDQFSEAAAVEKYLHSEQHPDYKFKPRKKSRGPLKDSKDDSDPSESSA